jgi:hypothetical protein
MMLLQDIQLKVELGVLRANDTFSWSLPMMPLLANLVIDQRNSEAAT